MCPVRIGLKRIRVGRRRNVDREAGVGIVAPGAAEIVGAFQDHEVMQVPLFELDPEAETREAGADDDDFMIHTDFGLHVFHRLSRTSLSC